MKCPTCEKKMGETTREHPVMVGAHTVTTRVRSYACPNGHEDLIDGPDMGRAELEVGAAIAASGHLSGASFRLFRTLLGLSARATASLLGIAHETISRWERDAREVDRLAWLTMGALVREQASGRSDLRDALEALSSPKPLPKAV